MSSEYSSTKEAKHFLTFTLTTIILNNLKTDTAATEVRLSEFVSDNLRRLMSRRGHVLGHVRGHGRGDVDGDGHSKVFISYIICIPLMLCSNTSYVPQHSCFTIKSTLLAQGIQHILQQQQQTLHVPHCIVLLHTTH